MLFLFLNYTDAQNSLKFSQISTQDGLSQNTVRSILVDKKGFVWAGTIDGLVRYDGTRFISHKAGDGERNQLSDSRIRDVKEDKDGLLWIRKYDNSYSCYDPVTEQFLSFEYQDDILPLVYTDYYESTSGKIWLYSSKVGAVQFAKGEGSKPVVVYKIPAIKTPLTGPNIQFILEDKDGKTWFGCSSGLNRMDENGKITQLYKDSEYGDFRTYITSEGYIYFLTGYNYVLKYSVEKKMFLKPYKAAQNYKFVDFCKFDATSLLISTRQNKLVRLDLQTGNFTLDISPLKNQFISRPRLIRDELHGLWVYDRSGKVQYYNYKIHQYSQMELVDAKTAKVIDDARYNILSDREGNYWITTYGNGLYTYNPKTNALVNYSYKKNSNSPASDYLLSIAQDSTGNIWIGTEYGGIVKVTHSKYKYSYIQPEDFEAMGSSNNVKVVYKDSDGQLWIGTKSGGLYLYDSNMQFVSCVKKGMNPYTIVEDRKGRIWIGSKGEGIYVLDKRSYKEIYHFVHRNKDTTSITSDAVFDIIEDDKDRIWIATFGGGLDLFEEKDHHIGFSHYFENLGNLSYLRCLMQDSQGKIWIGSYGGLLTFNPDDLIKSENSYTVYSYNTSHPSGLNSNDIKTIFEDSEHQIWVGTAGGGVNKWIMNSPDKQGEFKKYTLEEGLPSCMITSIQESKDGVLWVSTENGLSHLDKEKDTFLTYRFSDNFYGNYFSENAAILEKDGTMLWGTLDGLLVFNPGDSKNNQKVPPVILTDFYISDQRMESYLDDSPLKKSISYQDKVLLTYSQRTFSIGFACLDMSDVSLNKYSYKMEPYDDNWSLPNSNNLVTYKNMPPGTYTFKVKGSNAEGRWNKQITMCTVVVKPPLWKSAYAIVGYFIVLLGLIFVFILFFIRIHKLGNTVKMEKQLTDYKLRFFTNISHEFRTPLTLIKGSIERLSDQKGLPEETVKNVKLLKRNTIQMSRLIDQLLEFRKLQNNVLTLNLEKTDVKEFALEAYYTFKEMAFQKNMDYQFAGMDEHWEIYLDKNKVEKILFNLLSNAFRYTPVNGKIVLRVDKDSVSGNCVISVEDSGVGIAKDKQDMLFSRFMQINFSSEGTGIGLVLVKEFVEAHMGKITYKPNEGGGSVFVVELPSDKDIYRDARFVDTEGVTEEALSVEGDSENTKDHEVSRPNVPHNWKVLVIDDNFDIRNYLMEELGHHCHVEEAVDGKDGLEKAIAMDPTLIICDVKMPEMDGLELTRRLKDNFETSHIPVILLTSMSSDTIKLQGSESGADAYIMKPFSMKYLLSRVYNLIDQREKLKKRFSVDMEVKKGALSEAKKDQKFYDLINKIIDDNLSNPSFSVSDFTEKAELSRTIFYKKVKGLTGYSPNELIKVKRMKKAAELLSEGKFNVSEVSWKVGIEDPFYFSKCFKAQFGCAPSKYGSSDVSVE